MTRDLKEQVFDIVDRSGRGLTVTAVAEALAKDMTDEIGALLNALAEENRVRRTPQAAAILLPTTIFHRIGGFDDADRT